MSETKMSGMDLPKYNEVSIERRLPPDLHVDYGLWKDKKWKPEPILDAPVIRRIHRTRVIEVLREDLEISAGYSKLPKSSDYRYAAYHKEKSPWMVHALREEYYPPHFHLKAIRYYQEPKLSLFDLMIKDNTTTRQKAFVINHGFHRDEPDFYTRTFGKDGKTPIPTTPARLIDAFSIALFNDTLRRLDIEKTVPGYEFMPEDPSNKDMFDPLIESIHISEPINFINGFSNMLYEQTISAQ